MRAQIQLLVNYADAGATAAGLTHPVSPYLYGSDPVAAARKFDNFFAKGWAPTWREMGNGNWATDPGYSAKVIGIYRKMVAVRHRAGGRRAARARASVDRLDHEVAGGVEVGGQRRTGASAMRSSGGEWSSGWSHG